MEAPEKLYILFNHPYTVDYAKLNKRRCEEEVEYTRTDVFIKKACDWLINHNDYICGSTDGIVKYDMKQLVLDFKKYMEGE